MPRYIQAKTLTPYLLQDWETFIRLIYEGPHMINHKKVLFNFLLFFPAFVFN
jgi:hypothetical protein